MKLNKQKAFTIVELIVVITILAILGTIAFINLQGYNVGARDAKRYSDVNNLLNRVGLEEIKGTELVDLISDGVDIKSGLTIIGNVPIDAKQGIINFLKIKEPEDNFKDPDGSDYAFSYGIGLTSTGIYNYKQLATINEERNEAVVIGDYYKNELTDSPSILFSDATNLSGSFIVNGLSLAPDDGSNNLLTYECNGLIGSANPDQRNDDNGFPDFDLCTNIKLDSLNNIALSNNLTNNPGARDVYAFVLEQGKIYTLEALGDDYESDTAFFLYDNLGNKLAINDDIDGSIYRSSITYAPTYTGYYFLGVMGFGDGGTGLDYTLDISEGTIVPPPNLACGKDANKHLYVTPTRLCDSGTASSVTDGGILGDYTWTCGEIACSGRHAFAWDYTPTDIRDIFGNRSIYTENWGNNACDPSTMNVVDLNPGVDQIPTLLSDNTVYRLAAGDYIQTIPFQMNVWDSPTSVYFGNCSGLIGDGNVNLYTSVNMSYTVSMRNNNNIFSGISIYGTDDGLGGTHLGNNVGLSIFSPYSTVYNSNISQNNYDGIQEYGIRVVLNKLNIYDNGTSGIDKVSDNAIYTNINIYNNGRNGLYSDSGYNNVYSNIVSYNNNWSGIRFGREYGSSMNNIVTFNNNSKGTYGFNGAFTINNLFSYNNNEDGLKFYDRVEAANFNNINTYNNVLTGSFITGDAPGEASLYGISKSFGNLSADFQLSNYVFGTNSTLGFADGTSLDTSGTFGASWVVQPSMAGWNINTKGKQSLTFDGTETYTYGSNILNQTQPIRYDSNTYEPELWGVDGIHYDSTKKVGQW